MATNNSSNTGGTGSGGTGSGGTGSGGTGSSGSGSSGADNTGGTGGGSAGTGSTGGLPSIGDLTDGLKDIQKNGKADLKLSSATRDKYLSIISNFRSALQAQQKAIAGLPGLGFPGELASAGQTKQNLELDVTGLTGIEPAVNKYLDYLDEFEKTVKAAADKLIHSG